MLIADSGTENLASVRRGNLRRALQLVFDAPGKITRAAIVRRTGVSAATASSLVAELIADRLVIEGDQAQSTGGKRATTLLVDPSFHVILVVVVRKLEAMVAVLSLDSSTIAEERVGYAPENCRHEIEVLVTRIAKVYGRRLLVAAVQLPGATDGRVVLESVQLGWRDVELAEGLEQLLGVKVVLVNDVDAEATAESASEPDPVPCQLFIHIGLGIGASVMLRGEVLLPDRARIGEIGHVVVISGDAARKCRCGMHGCLESAASFAALAGAELNSEMPDNKVSALLDAVDDDRISAAATAMGRVIKLLAAMLDPNEVLLGGPARLLGDRFLNAVRDEVAYVATGTNSVLIRYATGQDIPYIGAAQIALSALLGVRWSAQLLMAARNPI